MKTTVYVCNVDPSYAGAPGGNGVGSSPPDDDPLDLPGMTWDEGSTPNTSGASEETESIDMHAITWDEEPGDDQN